MSEELGALVCLRASYHTEVAGSVYDRRCGRCKAALMIAPSGQAFLKEKPATPLLCHVCYLADVKAGKIEDVELVADIDTIGREMRSLRPNNFARRN